MTINPTNALLLLVLGVLLLFGNFLGDVDALFT